jgi:hypothetical protein
MRADKVKQDKSLEGRFYAVCTASAGRQVQPRLLHQGDRMLPGNLQWEARRADMVGIHGLVVEDKQ